MSTTDCEPTKDPKTQAHFRTNFMSLAVAAGYIDDGSTLHISYQKVIEETVGYCHYLLGRTEDLLDVPEAVLERAFGLGAYPETEEVESLMDNLPKLAGYQDSKPFPPVWNRLVKLTAQRCVEMVRGRQQVNLEPEDAVELAFGVVGFKPTASALIDYKAFLRHADHITKADQHQAEVRFEESMARQLGSPHRMYETHDAWERNPRTKRGQRWIEAQTVATREALVREGGVKVALLEIEFLYDL